VAARRSVRLHPAARSVVHLRLAARRSAARPRRVAVRRSAARPRRVLRHLRASDLCRTTSL